MTPSVSATSVNEWPEPEARTRSPRRAAPADDLGESLAGRRALDRGRVAALVARPVSPLGAIGQSLFVKLAPGPAGSRRGGRAVECGSLESC